MSDNAFRDALGNIQSEMANLLLERIRDKTATASDLAVARALLRDNAVQAKPVRDSPLGNLSKEIPTFDDHPTFN